MLEDTQLELRLSRELPGDVCAECGKVTTRHEQAPERLWRHLGSMGFETILTTRFPRANFQDHGIGQIKVPWGQKHSRFTLAFEAFAIKVLQYSHSVAAAK